MHRVFKITFTVAVAIVLIFSISSCTEKVPKIPELVTGFSGNADVELGETKLKCNISHTEKVCPRLLYQAPKT